MRQRMLAAAAARLKSLSEAFEIPVVVTNQITTKRTRANSSSSQAIRLGGVAGGDGEEGDGGGTVGGGETYLAPALGTTWSHCVTTRLSLSAAGGGGAGGAGAGSRGGGAGGVRAITVEKSPVAPRVSFRFVIGKMGVQPVA